MSREFRRSNLNKWTRNIEILKYRNIEIQKYIYIYYYIIYIYTHIVSILHYINTSSKKRKVSCRVGHRGGVLVMLGHASFDYLKLLVYLILLQGLRAEAVAQCWGNSGEVGREITGKISLGQAGRAFSHSIRKQLPYVFAISCHASCRHQTLIRKNQKEKNYRAALLKGIIVCVPLMFVCLAAPNSQTHQVRVAILWQSLTARFSNSLSEATESSVCRQDGPNALCNAHVWNSLFTHPSEGGCVAVASPTWVFGQRFSWFQVLTDLAIQERRQQTCLWYQLIGQMPGQVPIRLRMFAKESTVGFW